MGFALSIISYDVQFIKPIVHPNASQAFVRARQASSPGDRLRQGLKCMLSMVFARLGTAKRLCWVSGWPLSLSMDGHLPG